MLYSLIPSDGSQCVRPIIGENRILTETSRQDNFPDGSTLTYKCSTGYVPEQPGSSNSITCKGNQWTELQLQLVKCEPPPSIQNGNFDPMDEVYQYDQAVTYSCEKDYNLIGESTISCSDNGSFPPPPRCLKISCDAPTIENAVRTGGKSPPYKYKEFVEYQCNTGYKMEGSRSLTCEENGWNPSPPLCIEDKIGPGPIPITDAPLDDKAQCVRPIIGENRILTETYLYD
ncbi:C4b-binding protein alpha chain-like [Tachysurus vachellii]|uniref:C4b-binding protein alpha chain-like n=1 Tax=Tachysurus vachellii TaxID=175792 RepID=UPI00296AEF6D|nr:C4b-binding protein alpha chain-like [Tachysurus vachellii]